MPSLAEQISHHSEPKHYINRSYQRSKTRKHVPPSPLSTTDPMASDFCKSRNKRRPIITDDVNANKNPNQEPDNNQHELHTHQTLPLIRILPPYTPPYLNNPIHGARPSPTAQTTIASKSTATTLKVRESLHPALTSDTSLNRSSILSDNGHLRIDSIRFCKHIMFKLPTGYQDTSRFITSLIALRGRECGDPS